VRSVRDASPAPAAVGFGIGTPEQAAQVGAIADGVIIGTRLVRLVADAGGPEAAADSVAGFLADVRVALEGV
jgi:tryptophan synthase alpha chain